MSWVHKKTNGSIIYNYNEINKHLKFKFGDNEDDKERL